MWENHESYCESYCIMSWVYCCTLSLEYHLHVKGAVVGGRWVVNKTLKKKKRHVSFGCNGWLTEQPLKVALNVRVLCEGPTLFSLSRSESWGKYVLLGQTPCVALSGADKKRTVEILIKIVALAIKSDRGESELFLCCHYSQKKKSGKWSLFLHLQKLQLTVIAPCTP